MKKKEDLIKIQLKKEYASSLESIDKNYEEIKSKIYKLAVKMSDLEDLYRRRLSSDKNTSLAIDQITSFLKYKNIEDIFLELLLVVDRLEDSGIELNENIAEEILTIFNRRGIKAIDNTIDFNPKFHQAIKKVNGNKKEDRKIIEVVRKGYIFNEKVLRPSKVIISISDGDYED